MKKNGIYKIGSMLLVVLITFMMFNPVVFAADEVFNVCQKSGIVKTFQIIGYGLFLIKVVVPILLIAMASVEFGKAVIASDDNAIKNAISLLIKRAIAGVIIFFIPTLIRFVIGIVDNSDDMSDFGCLSNCIASPTKCAIPADGGVFGSQE